MDKKLLSVHKCIKGLAINYDQLGKQVGLFIFKFLKSLTSILLKRKLHRNQAFIKQIVLCRLICIFFLMIYNKYIYFLGVGKFWLEYIFEVLELFLAIKVTKNSFWEEENYILLRSNEITRVTLYEIYLVYYNDTLNLGRFQLKGEQIHCHPFLYMKKL